MGLLDKLFGRGKAKQPPPEARPRYDANIRGPGHCGVAIGSLEDKDLSAANIAKWQTLTGGEIERFLYDGEVLPVHSTNVATARYFIGEQKLLLEYLDGAAWEYTPIPESMAEAFVQAQSKGAWTWDYLKVRGPGNKGKHRPGINAVQIR
jgi:hypothetical protein